MIDDGAGVVVLLHVARAWTPCGTPPGCGAGCASSSSIWRRPVWSARGRSCSRSIRQPSHAMINVDVIGNGDSRWYTVRRRRHPTVRPRTAYSRRARAAACRTASARGRVGMPGMPPGDDLSFVQPRRDTAPYRFARDLVEGRRSPPLVVPPRRPPARPARGARARGPARHSHRTRQRRVAHARRDDAGIPCGNRCAPRHGRGAVLTAERSRSLPEKSAGSSIGNVRLRKSLTPIGMSKQGKRSAL